MAVYGAKTYSRLSVENLEIGGVALNATATEINAATDISAKFVAAGSTLTVTAALHASKYVQLDTTTGSVCTLPAATGTGNVYTFITTVLATSNSHKIQVANSTDVMTGALMVVDDDSSSAVTAFGTTSTSDTITLNRTTTGSVRVGERIQIVDVKTGFFSVSGVVIGNGTIATPFSAAV